MAHRHDIRVGKAAGMVLKGLVPDTAKRLELLAMLYPCYWRWSTKKVLEVMVANIDQLLASDSQQRAQIVKGAYDSMTLAMRDYQVVGFQRERRVELLPRSESKRLCSARKNTYGYHPYSNPSSRRTGDKEFSILADDVESGNLWRVCEALSEEWKGNPTYQESEKIIKRGDIKLWRGPKYGRTRFRNIALGSELPCTSQNHFQFVFI